MEAKLLYENFVNLYSPMKKQCEEIKSKYGEHWWIGQERIITARIEMRMREDITCQTKVQAVIAMSSNVDCDEIELHSFFACITDKDLEDFKKHLEHPVIKKATINNNN